MLGFVIAVLLFFTFFSCCSSVDSPICREGRSERTFPIFSLFLDFPLFSQFFHPPPYLFFFFLSLSLYFSYFFPDFEQILTCQKGHSSPCHLLATPLGYYCCCCCVCCCYCCCCCCFAFVVFLFIIVLVIITLLVKGIDHIISTSEHACNALIFI